MQTTATTQVTSDISSEPVGKAERRKKLKSVAIRQLTVYSSFADGNHYNGEIQIFQPLVDRMTIVPLAERPQPAAHPKEQRFRPTRAQPKVISQSFTTNDGSYPLFRHLPGNRQQYQATSLSRVVLPVVEYVRGALCM